MVSRQAGEVSGASVNSANRAVGKGDFAPMGASESMQGSLGPGARKEVLAAGNISLGNSHLFSPASGSVKR